MIPTIDEQIAFVEGEANLLAKQVDIHSRSNNLGIIQDNKHSYIRAERLAMRQSILASLKRLREIEREEGR